MAPLPEFGRVYAGDCVDLINGWDEGWADIIVSGPSATGTGQDRRDRETRWIEAFKHALKYKGLLVTIWPFKDMWDWGRLLCELKFSVQALYRVTYSGTYPNWASQAIMVARNGSGPEPVKPIDTHFNSKTKSGWSSGYHPEIAERVVATLAGPIDVVFDPFFGRGNTAIGCIKAKRSNWVGCEIEESRIPEAYERIERMTDWTPLVESTT